MACGDDGIKRFFQRIHEHLVDGGRYIMEYQSFESYKKKANAAEKAVIQKLNLRPELFETYLIDTIGFKEVHKLGTSPNASKGFQRPIHMYIK